MKCRGNETAVTDCYHKNADDCDGTEAAGVVCAQDTLDIPDDCREEPLAQAMFTMVVWSPCL